MATYVEGWAAAARCADAAISAFLTYGTIPELVEWFYDDVTISGSDDWDECVLQMYWDTHTWRGVFRAWDECGRPAFDPYVWCDWDKCGPDLRRSAQGNARLDSVGQMVYIAFPDAIERAAVARGWAVLDGSFWPDGRFPAGAIALDTYGLEAAAGCRDVPVLIPPAPSAVA